jgi:hypothetical protein
MKSHPFFAINLPFTAPSYYFCFRRRERQEKVIEMMMTANDFRPGEEMPETVPLDESHPFLNVKDKEVVEGGSGGEDGERSEGDLQKEFVARLKEKKEWEAPHPRGEDADKVFKEVKRR